MAANFHKAKTGSSGVSLSRARRLVGLIQLLGAGAMIRGNLMRKLHLDIRGFYRDLQCLRKAGIRIKLRDGKYALLEKVEESLVKLPFPDPGLSLGEAMLLAKGTTAVHRKLKHMIDVLRGASTSSRSTATRPGTRHSRSPSQRGKTAERVKGS